MDDQGFIEQAAFDKLINCGLEGEKVLEKEYASYYKYGTPRYSAYISKYKSRPSVWSDMFDNAMDAVNAAIEEAMSYERQEVPST